MKILVVCYPGHKEGGGVASYTYCLLQGLIKNGHEVILASTDEYPGIKTYIFQAFRKMPIFYFRDLYLLKFLKNIWSKEGNFDLIYSADYRFSSMAAFKLSIEKQCPMSVHYHDYWFNCLRGDRLYRKKFVCDGANLKHCLSCAPWWRLPWEYYKYNYFQKKKKLVSQAATHLAVSQTMAKQLALAGFNRGVQVVYCPMEFASLDKEAQVDANIASFVKDKIVISFVGKFIHHRGIDTLLAVVKEFSAGCKEVVFLAAGDGEMFEHAKRYVVDNKLNNIKLLGWLPYQKMSDIYRVTDLVFFPSTLEEPFSRMLIETMSYGLPIVASRRGGNQEAIQEGESGLLVNPFDIEECVAKLLELVNNNEKRKSFGLRAKELSEQYQADKIIKNIESIFKDTINK